MRTVQIIEKNEHSSKLIRHFADDCFAIDYFSAEHSESFLFVSDGIWPSITILLRFMPTFIFTVCELS